MKHSTTTTDRNDHPSRLLIEAGVKRGTGPLVTAASNDACPICGYWSCRCGKAQVTR